MKKVTRNNTTIIFFKKVNDIKYSFVVEDDKELTEKLYLFVKNKRIREDKIKYAISRIFDIISRIKEIGNDLKVYAIEWHNHKNFTNKYFGEDYDTAKKVYDECSSKDSFSYCCLREITCNILPIFKTLRTYNKSEIIEYLSGYDLNGGCRARTIYEKNISDNKIEPKLDTSDLCNYLDAV